MQILEVRTARREEILDITRPVAELVRRQGWTDGALMLFGTHTTCGLTINEGADPDVRRDLMRFFNEIAPKAHGWSHAEGNTDAHIRASLLGASLLVPLENGALCLGRWQSIYLYEGDGPRTRTVLAQRLRAED
ncbi:MAG: YjbQ family protein [Desulfovibrio sp.]|nr:YjbQ family protein [Desulfovibrio sp.]